MIKTKTKTTLLRCSGLIKTDFHKPGLFKKAEMVLRILLILIIAAIFLAQLDKMYSIPLNQPYYTGTWDEPFSINAGINVLHQGGDPSFYNYGGTSIYPYAFVFYIYGKATGTVPEYNMLDTAFKNPDWPMSRKIYPVKPIYITRVIAYIIFLSLAFLYVALFSYLLIPVPFWLIPSITTAAIFSNYAMQMLPETHLGILAGLTAIAFAKAIVTGDIAKYYRWLLICAAAASFTAAVKINAFFIVLLPLSLIWRVVQEKYLTFNWISKEQLKRWIFLAVSFILPYVLVNPAIVINFKGYKAWLSAMRQLSGVKPESWADRDYGIVPFLKDLYLSHAFPVFLVIILLVLACIFIVKRNAAAFAGFMIFFLHSLYTIANMKHMLYARHFVFLLLPFNILILFPFIHFFRVAPRSIKAGVTLICLLITLWIFPPGKTIAAIGNISPGKFNTQWQRESRDELIDFVIANDAVLYFYDYHGFSLPHNLRDRIIPFSEVTDAPDHLKSNEYVALILYKTAGQGQVDQQGKYIPDRDLLLNKYKTIKTLGKPGGNNDINKQAPQVNPTILILKEN
ncbi:MAG: hypothetical protein MUF15_00955 [Acidobacteria bacterium]|nr:hypothetical protein [Acidobacteriota bacterium]